MDASEYRQAGEDALAQGDWAAAKTAFSRSCELQETPEALEGLGTALWWQDDQQPALDAREQAFRLYRAAGDLRGAARIATWLALDYVDFRGDLASCAGWLQRAERLLKDQDLAPEHGWLPLYQGFVALMFENDLPLARTHLKTAAELAPSLGVIDIEMMTVALEGLILIREGKVADGMRHLDEAMTAAVGGEMSDLAAIGNTCCTLIYACEAVADYDRAARWCERTREFCRRLGMDTFFAICRNYYATVLIWKGDWEAADLELTAAMREMPGQRQNYINESLAKLGLLRLRQGRIAEAESLLAQAEPHRLALLGRAALALERQDADSAVDLLQRVLRRVGEEDQAEHVFALEQLVRARILSNELDAADASLAELESLASRIGTQPLRATANAARGALALARGQHDTAKLQFEDAIDLFEACDAAFDAARIRLDNAATLRALGREAGALEQAMIAQTTFKRLGARLHAEAAGRLVTELSARFAPAPADGVLPHNLTAREAEVLWLIAAGKTNQEIAQDLVLSVRTVERHISTIYEKLNLHGRAARASAAAFAVSLRAGR